MKRTKNMTYNPTTESRELMLYTVNDGDIYRGATTATINNLRKKNIDGIYDKEKAVDAWYYVASLASNKYFREFGYRFSVTDRFTCAVELEEYYKEHIEE